MTRKTEQTDLFSQQFSTQNDMYLLTGQGNLVDILSSGQIKPSSQYKKYYGDPGKNCPTAIPLFFGAPPADFIRQVESKDVTIYPVLIQVNMDGIKGKGTLIDLNLNLQEVQLPYAGTGTVLIVPGVLPVGAIRSVHFRKDEELKEFSIRKYANLPAEKPETMVTPELFEGNSQSIDLLIEKMGQAGRQYPPTDKGVIQGIQAMGGMLLLAGCQAKEDERLPLSVLTAMMEFVKSFPDRDTGWKALKELPEEFRWLTGMAAILPGEAGGFSLEKIIDINGSRGDDAALFTRALQMMTGIEPAEFSMDEFLEALGNELLNKSIPSGKDAAIEFNQIVKQIGRVKIGDMPKDDFLEKFPAAERPLPAALLTFLLRKEPGYILDAARVEDPMNTIQVMGMALMLSGALYGRTLIPTELHPSDSFRKWLDPWLAVMQNKLAGGVTLTANLETLGIISALKGKPEALMAGDLLLLQRAPVKMAKPKIEPAKEIYERMKKEKELTEKAKPTVIMTPVQAEETRKQFLAANLGDANSSDTLKAIEICKKMGWDELVRSKVNLDGKDYIVEFSSLRREFRVQGFIAVRTELHRVDEFKKKLNDLDLKKLQEILGEGQKA